MSRTYYADDPLSWLSEASDDLEEPTLPPGLFAAKTTTLHIDGFSLEAPEGYRWIGEGIKVGSFFYQPALKETTELFDNFNLDELTDWKLLPYLAKIEINETPALEILNWWSLGVVTPTVADRYRAGAIDHATALALSTVGSEVTPRNACGDGLQTIGQPAWGEIVDAQGGLIGITHLPDPEDAEHPGYVVARIEHSNQVACVSLETGSVVWRLDGWDIPTLLAEYNPTADDADESLLNDFASGTGYTQKIYNVLGAVNGNLFLRVEERDFLPSVTPYWEQQLTTSITEPDWWAETVPAGLPYNLYCGFYSKWVHKTGYGSVDRTESGPDPDLYPRLAGDGEEGCGLQPLNPLVADLVQTADMDLPPSGHLFLDPEGAHAVVCTALLVDLSTLAETPRYRGHYLEEARVYYQLLDAAGDVVATSTEPDLYPTGQVNYNGEGSTRQIGGLLSAHSLERAYPEIEDDPYWVFGDRPQLDEFGDPDLTWDGGRWDDGTKIGHRTNGAAFGYDTAVGGSISVPAGEEGVPVELYSISAGPCVSIGEGPEWIWISSEEDDPETPPADDHYGAETQWIQTNLYRKIQASTEQHLPIPEPYHTGKWVSDGSVIIFLPRENTVTALPHLPAALDTLDLTEAEEIERLHQIVCLDAATLAPLWTLSTQFWAGAGDGTNERYGDCISNGILVGERLICVLYGASGQRVIEVATVDNVGDGVTAGQVTRSRILTNPEGGTLFGIDSSDTFDNLILERGQLSGVGSIGAERGIWRLAL